MTDNINGMSKTRLSMFADSLKDLTYKEMSYISQCIVDEIATYNQTPWTPADVLVTVADNLLEELNET